jgi:NAD-dependent SIR2 family protein deacetylase
MAIKILVEKRIMGKVVSQNVDGLHRKSGVEPERLSELHGNTNLEICAKCKKNYLRDYRTRTAKSVHDHLTGRSCDNKKCNGKLKDSIINFGENLDEETLENGFKWGK